MDAWGRDLDAEEHFQHYFCGASASIQVEGQAHGERFHHGCSGTSYWTIAWPAQLCLCQETLPAHLYWSQTALCKALQWRSVHLQCGPTFLPPSLAFPSSALWQLHACDCEQKIIILGAGWVHVCVYVCVLCVCVRFLLCWISSLVQPTAQLCPVKASTEKEREHTVGPWAFFGLKCFTNHTLWVVHPVLSHPA